MLWKAYRGSLAYAFHLLNSIENKTKNSRTYDSAIQKDLGHSYSTEAIERMKKSQQARWKNGAHGPNYGKKFSEECRQKMSLAKKGRSLTETQRNFLKNAGMETRFKKGHPCFRKGANKNKVQCIETGAIFNTISLAAEFCQTTVSNLSKCLQGKTKTAKKLHWQYLNEVQSGTGN
jgi:hypothetical protein